MTETDTTDTSGHHDRGGWVNTDKARESREQKFNEHTTVYPDFINEDGSATDVAAQKVARDSYNRGGASPRERVADDHSVGTPAWLEVNSPANMHSDGGPTLAPEMDSVLDVHENSDELKSDIDAEIESGPEQAEKNRHPKDDADENEDDNADEQVAVSNPADKSGDGDRQ